MMARKKYFCHKYLNIMVVKIFSKRCISTSWTRKKILGKMLNGAKFNLTLHLQLNFENESLACADKQYSS